MPVKRKETNSEENKIYDEYFGYTKDLKQKYGDRSIVLMLVGAFFEVYGLKNIETEEVSKSNIIDFITIGSTGNATDFGDLTVGREIMNAGASSSTRGMFFGGNT